MEHQNNQQKLSNPNLTREDILMIEAFSKIFKKDKKEIIDLIDLRLFSNSNFHLARIFECLSRMREEKLINALISLEYLLAFDKTIKDISE